MRQLLFKTRVALVVTVAIALARSAPAQGTVVIGTGNPDPRQAGIHASEGFSMNAKPEWRHLTVDR